jgi:hypothetical protein
MTVVPRSISRVALAALVAVAACAGPTPPANEPAPAPDPRNDQRVGLKAGLFNAGEAISNLKVVARAVSPEGHLGATNSDLAFRTRRARRSWPPTPARPRRTTCRSTGT